MTTAYFVLPKESTEGRGGQEANVHLINGYAEQMGAEKDGKAEYVVYASPGLTRWDAGSFVGAERGSIVLNNGTLVSLMGSQLVQFDPQGTPTVVGAIPGTDRVFMARNRNGSPQIGIVTSKNLGYYVLQNSVLTKPVEPNLPAPNSIAYLKGGFFYGIPDGRIFSSPQEQATGIESIAYATANSDSGGIVRLFSHAGYMYAFGPRNFEIWQYTGETPFPLSPVQQYIALGLQAPYSLAETDQGLLWVDHKGFVRYGRDGGSARISTHSVERAISNLSDYDKGYLVGSIATFEGHECYVLNAPTQFTWLYDIQAQRWTERRSQGQDRWMANSFTWFNTSYICGTDNSGKLYKLNMSDYTEDGNDYVFEVWCQSTHNFPHGMIIDRLDLDVVSGVGNPASVETTTPMIMVDYSDDGGITFQGERLASIGAIGDFRKLVRLGRWGRIGQKGRVWRVRASAAVLRVLIGGALTGRPCL